MFFQMTISSVKQYARLSILIMCLMLIILKKGRIKARLTDYFAVALMVLMSIFARDLITKILSSSKNANQLAVSKK